MSLARVAHLALALAVLPPPAAAQNPPPTPCLGVEPFSDFGFWVGDWDVYAPNGNQAGTNTSEELEQGCLLLENWTGATGGTGKSINFYDPGRELWRQIWVSSNGVVIEIEGGLRDGSMVLEGTLTNAAGQVQPAPPRDRSAHGPLHPPAGPLPVSCATPRSWFPDHSSVTS